MNCLHIFVIVLYFSTVYSNTLQQVHVIFRHGDRNPSSLYPKDPHLNDTWYPDGKGQLTNLGKMQEYNIGKALRMRYNDFLGEIYYSDIVEPLSTDYNRTKMSLELVLAGLFPPAPSQIWNSFLPWQPIPYNYVSWQTDPVMRYALFNCQKYTDLYNEALKEELFDNFLKTNTHLLKHINNNTGLEINSYLDLFDLYGVLHAEVNTGRQLPEWNKTIYPDFLIKAAILYYELQMYTDEMKKYAGGNMLKKILTDAEAKINGKLTPKDRKIFLYSGHEYNMGYILGVLKIYKPHLPPYAAYLIVELHKINNEYGFKVLYQDYSTSSLKQMIIPGCNIFCKYSKFLYLLNSVIPSNDTRC